MFIVAASAAFVGLVHSLAPGHWLPVVLMAKTRRWPMKTAVVGAVIAASGHIFLSIALGLASIWIGVHYFSAYEEQIEQYAGLALGVFGLIYATLAYFRHSGCHGHTHHGPEVESEFSSDANQKPKSGHRKTPFLFLFTLGFTPCVAVLPVFAAASSWGSLAIVLSFVAFSLGVLASLIGSTLLVSLGLVKLDHPVLEHYGDVITGSGVAIMGVLLFLFSAH
jgi:nickel/cobalt exporter